MKKETFDELRMSIEQGRAVLRGKKAPNREFRVDNPNVSAIRRHLGLTQQKFAELLGISPATLAAGDISVRYSVAMRLNGTSGEFRIWT